MAIVDIPKSPDDLSPEWLTAALQSSGARNARVASFEYEPIAAGVGFLGKLGRLRLRHAEGGEGLPRTLIVKQPTQDAKSRQLAMMFRFYEREVSFYRDVGSAAGIRVPTMYFGAADPKSGDFVMLMEDLGAGAARRPARRVQRRGRAFGSRRPRQMSCPLVARALGSRRLLGCRPPTIRSIISLSLPTSNAGSRSCSSWAIR